jgi:hypothetical protein
VLLLLLLLLQEVTELVLSDLAAAGQELDEQGYLQLARVAGISGDPDKVRHCCCCCCCWW